MTVISTRMLAARSARTVVRTGFDSGELLLVNGVERREIAQVDEVHEARDNVVERRSGSLEQRVDVVEGLFGLLDQVVADQLPCLRVEAALA